MWYFCGFNGFGQFGKAHASRVMHVTNFDLHLPSEDFIICPAWSCNIIGVKNEVILSGFAHTNGKSLDNFVFPREVTDISASHKYCLVLLDSGQLFKLTRNDLSIQEVRFADVEVVPNRKRKIFEKISDKQSDIGDVPMIKHIACGSNLAVAISSNNVVYSIPTKTHQFPGHMRIVSLQCGFEHAISLNSNGDVYTWGNGLRGQLGIDDMRMQESPILVEALSGIKIVSIAAGGWHSAAISSFGDIYTWGFNCNGQLGIRVFKSNGIKNPSVYPLPQIIDLPQCCECSNTAVEESSCNTVAVYTGARHTIVKNSCGSIFAAGWNSYGQLALAKGGNMVDEFTKITKMPKGDVNVICGPWCTIFRATNKISKTFDR